VIVVNNAIAAVQGNPSFPTAFSGFLGFVSNDATLITSVRFDSPGTGVEAFTLDNLRFTTGRNGGGPNPLPEPSSLALVALGALGLIARRRSRK
jgi:hypothetical protein